jgi:hypothetical protein
LCKMTFRNGVYYCTATDVEAKDHHNRWSVETTQYNIADGTWKFVRSLDEPELVFPFTVKTDSDNIYTITSNLNGGVIMTSTDGLQYKHVDNEMAKNFIKKGLWIVQSVGSPKVEGSTTASNNATSLVDSLKLSVTSEGVKEATEAFKELAQRIENVNIALESMQQIMTDMGLATKDEPVDMNGRPLSQSGPLHINAVHDFNSDGRSY